jgi:hypothetical protein
MSSSGILRHVALVRTNGSEEHSTSIIRVTRIGELGTTSAVTSNHRTLRRNTWCNIPEDSILHSRYHENLKSYKDEQINSFYCKTLHTLKESELCNIFACIIYYYRINCNVQRSAASFLKSV